jgi:hypothetical protein
MSLEIIMSHNEKRDFDLWHRRKQVAELFLQGWSQPAIAEHLHVSQPTICADLKAIRQEWRESALRDFDELRAIELQKLDFMEREAWAGWFRSQKPAQSAIVTGDGAGNLTRKSMKHQMGDPRYLAIVNQSIAQRRAIFGLDLLPAPVSPTAQNDGNLSLESRQQQVLALLAAFRERARIGDAAAPPDAQQPGDVRPRDEPGALDDGPTPRVPGPDAPESD